MLRVFFPAVFLLAASLQGALAESRDRLDGFNGVSFGTTYADAKRALGATAKEDSKVTGAHKTIKTLLVDMTLDGQVYRDAFIFGSAGRLSRVAITPKNVAFGKDQAACDAAGAAMVESLLAKYGAPTTDTTDGGGRTLTFTFKDKNEIEASLDFGPFGCLTYAAVYTPAGKNQ